MSLSKGKKRNSGTEIIHTLDSYQVLKPNDSLLFFIQRVRDEAHRFAITAHRRRRNIQSIRSIFNEISGIGSSRKKKLMNHFGTISKIKKVSIHQLHEVKGISRNLAEKIYDYFHS